VRSIYFILAEGSSIDGQTNVASAFKIVEAIETPSFPVLVGPVDLICLIERNIKEEPTKVGGFLRSTLDEQELFTHPIAFDFENKSRSRIQINLQGILIPRPGTVKISLLSNDLDQEIGTWTFEATVAQNLQALKIPVQVK
jgi:hypothetical protein